MTAPRERSSTPKPHESPAVIILAAGQGKRMRSPLPKVLHDLGGLPLLFHILRAVKGASPHARIGIVVGHGREKVEQAVRGHAAFEGLDLAFIHQPEQRGTGHAARCAMDSAWGAEVAKAKLPVLVLPGDLPLIPVSLVSQMLEPLGKTAAMRLLTCELDDPAGYGRVVRRGKSGPVLRIVEERDANLREKAVREVAASIYLFQSSFLKVALHRLSDRNAQGEYYLTDLVALSARARKRVDVLRWQAPEDLRGINDPWELSQAGKILNERHLKNLALGAGVRFTDPGSTWVDVTVSIGEGTRVEPGAILAGDTRIGKGCLIGARCQLKDTEVGDGAEVKAGTISDSSVIGAGSHVGPYAHFRPGSRIGAGAKIGNFVELKKTTVGAGTSIAHLSYLGDAEVGARVNIGCGFITCNFDGRVIDGDRKHRTIIEDDVFLGSDCQTVAPIRIGKGAYVASGSTITENVEPEALAIARARQVNKPGYARKLKT